MKRLRLTAIVGACAAVFTQAWATGMFQVGLQELSTGAERIVQAKVMAVVTQWNRDSTIIFTYARMNIVDDIIGPDEDSEIIIKQPGGRIGTLTLAVEGTAQYRVGETDVLFLNVDPENSAAFQTIGMYQGKYTVYSGADQVERVRQEGGEGVTLYKRGSGAIDTGNNLTLDEFKQLILQYRNEK